MANFTEVRLKKPTAEAIGKKIRSISSGAPQSVEVMRDGDNVIFRIWFEAHCELANHTRLGGES
jgi:hypothetical protein